MWLTMTQDRRAKDSLRRSVDRQEEDEHGEVFDPRRCRCRFTSTRRASPSMTTEDGAVWVAGQTAKGAVVTANGTTLPVAADGAFEGKGRPRSRKPRPSPLRAAPVSQGRTRRWLRREARSHQPRRSSRRRSARGRMKANVRSTREERSPFATPPRPIGERHRQVPSSMFAPGIITTRLYSSTAKDGLPDRSLPRARRLRR